MSENLLRHAASPYLQQHADNPVHWRVWGPEALAEAKALNKPILLSIGYAACHWCHVMAHESFEDEATAAVMNELYVSIKVDREERPDIDALYMNALHLLGEQGGWPLTMFLTPEGEPFWGGTYFPPQPRYGRPSFTQVLRGVARAFHEEGDKVAQNIGALRQGLDRMAANHPGPLPDQAALEQVALALVRNTDAKEGGFGNAPKFPNAPIFRFLWQMRFRLEQPACAEVVELLLRKMSQGGIWDHLGGGYARYAVDGIWLVPHFEKMLYDNAQLLELLAFAHAAKPDPLFARRAEEMVGWLKREMLAGKGAFAATLDADSEGEEGKFYVWSEAEIDALLGERAAFFKEVYDVSPGGNWEHKNILNRREHAAFYTEDKENILTECRALLLEARAHRIPPGRDDKVLADWNGLMIGALVRAAAVFERPDWLALAKRAFLAVVAALRGPDGRLAHAWREGHGVSAAGLLEDQACMARAALALYEATGDETFLGEAIAWAEITEQHFAAPDGGYFTSADDATDVLHRGRQPGDNAVPSGNGVLAEVQARLYHLTGDDRWRVLAESTIGAFTGLTQALTAMPGLLAAADLLESGAVVVVAGDPAEEGAQALAQAALRHPDPALILLRAPTPESLPEGHPAHGKGPVGGKAAAYVCRANRCGLPLTEAAALREALARRA
ncbi:thioredoxin domain-containing protein [Acetobacteraceae bacterium H6797]|nr:thioredoxin domain-containing protein [Acetobacteraceae bacterium H6797]